MRTAKVFGVLFLLLLLFIKLKFAGTCTCSSELNCLQRNFLWCFPSPCLHVLLLYLSKYTLFCVSEICREFVAIPSSSGVLACTQVSYWRVSSQQTIVGSKAGRALIGLFAWSFQRVTFSHTLLALH